MNLVDSVRASTNSTQTQNGASSNKSTLDACLDMFSRIGALRHDVVSALKLFKDALVENPVLAVALLFYTRDIRNGMGERNIFRVCMDFLLTAKNRDCQDIYNAVIGFTPNYGRWDDVIRHYELNATVRQKVKHHLSLDLAASELGQECTLLGKWLPSLTASNRTQKALAKAICHDLGWTQKQYRKNLRKLREHLNVVESKMCSGRWEEIDYAAVPSQAMLRLRSAFGKHDQERFNTYINSVEKGEAKINAGTLTPDQIIKQIMQDKDQSAGDPALNALWDNLPTFGEPQDTIVMADVSGSMYDEFDSIFVSIALAMYMAERNVSGHWQNKFMTFTDEPALEVINPLNSIDQKLEALSSADWGMSTNIEGAVKTLIDSAVEAECELPDNLVIVSDMEFNAATDNYYGNSPTNLDAMRTHAEMAGLTLPTIVFWNVCSRGNQVPATKNDDGVILISGRSPTILSMAFSNDYNPESFMKAAVLDNERYAPIVNAIDKLNLSFNSWGVKAP